MEAKIVTEDHAYHLKPWACLWAAIASTQTLCRQQRQLLLELRGRGGVAKALQLHAYTHSKRSNRSTCKPKDSHSSPEAKAGILNPPTACAGSNDNFSWNCGAEGECEDGEVVWRRERQMRNLMVALMVSQGTPMVLSGESVQSFNLETSCGTSNDVAGSIAASKSEI